MFSLAKRLRYRSAVFWVFWSELILFFRSVALRSHSFTGFTIHGTIALVMNIAEAMRPMMASSMFFRFGLPNASLLSFAGRCQALGMNVILDSRWRGIGFEI